MTIYYSSLYGQNPSNTADYIYKGPHPKEAGQLLVRRCSYTGPLAAATSDKLKLFQATAGERLVFIANNRSADPDAANDFTFNLGWTSAPTGVASASTGMQATTKVEYTAGDLILVAAAAEGDALEVNAQAGAAEVTTVVHSFIIGTVIPA